MIPELTDAIISLLEARTTRRCGDSRPPGNYDDRRDLPDLILYGSIDGDTITDNPFIEDDGQAITVYQVTITALSARSRDIQLRHVRAAMKASLYPVPIATTTGAVSVLKVTHVSTDKQETDDDKIFTGQTRWAFTINETDT